MIAKHQLPKLFARCAKQVGTEIPTSFPPEAVSPEVTDLCFYVCRYYTTWLEAVAGPRFRAFVLKIRC